MSIEKMSLKNTSEENKIAEEEKRKRVENIWRGDNEGYEDSVMDLAKKEDKRRMILKNLSVKLSKEEIDMLADSFSDEVLKAIEINKEKLKDSLTGIFNRSFFQENIPKILNIEKREGGNCALLFIDFDNFKSINDNYGHQAGDEALKQIVKTIQGKIRKSDFLFRWGGDEFAMFTSAFKKTEDILKLAEKIVQAVADTPIKITINGTEKEIVRTISVGCAVTNQISEWKKNENEFKEEEVLKKLEAFADAAVYKSKKNGKGKVSMYDANDEEIKEGLNKDLN